MKVLKTSAGIYLNLYYQSQIVEYNNSTLIQYNAEDYENTKLILEEFDYKLSREYASKM